jgi:hypothetical protein
MSSNNNNNNSNSNSSNNDDDEPFTEKMKRVTGNCFKGTGLCCFKFKERSQIQLLEQKVSNRQKKFGVDYMNLVQDKAPQDQLRKCLQDALRDTGGIQEEINEHHDKIDEQTEQVNSQIKRAPGAEHPVAASVSVP